MTISHVFAAPKKAAGGAAKEAKAAKSSPVSEKKLVSEDPRVQAFYDQLTPKEVVAHLIAVDKLGTSYDVTRTHGFLRWSKANPVL